MSSIFIHDIQGEGTFAVPEDDTQLNSCSSALDGILSAVPFLTYANVSAWVTEASEGISRALNASVSSVLYNGEACPSDADTDVMVASIQAALLAHPEITSVSIQTVNLEAVPAQPAQPTAHATTHQLAGSDALNADKVVTPYVPTNYTRTVDPPDVTDVTEVGAHLRGIDNAITGGGGGADEGDVIDIGLAVLK